MACKICAEREKNKIVEANGKKRRVCDTCSKPIPRYRAMDGSGFESHTVDHVHQVFQKDDTGKKIVIEDPVHKELCHSCYLEDFKKNYPNQPLPQITNVEAD